jgi:predicted component of type VI protein secretion system
VQVLWDEVEKTTILSKEGKFSLDELPTDEVVPDPAEAPTVVLQFTLQLQQGAASEERLFFAESATIGRGKDCDLQLTDDTSISRLHAVLTKNADQTFTLLAQGKNPLKLSDGQELAAEQQAQLQRGDRFKIGAYELTIQ